MGIIQPTMKSVTASETITMHHLYTRRELQYSTVGRYAHLVAEFVRSCDNQDEEEVCYDDQNRNQDFETVIPVPECCCCVVECIHDEGGFRR